MSVRFFVQMFATFSHHQTSYNRKCNANSLCSETNPRRCYLNRPLKVTRRRYCKYRPNVSLQSLRYFHGSNCWARAYLHLFELNSPFFLVIAVCTTNAQYKAVNVRYSFYSLSLAWASIFSFWTFYLYLRPIPFFIITPCSSISDEGRSIFL